MPPWDGGGGQLEPRVLNWMAASRHASGCWIHTLLADGQEVACQQGIEPGDIAVHVISAM